MALYKVPVDFYVRADHLKELDYQVHQFLKHSVDENGFQYQIVKWELPVGYPAESLDESIRS